MAQLYVNNGATTLSATLANGATSASVTSGTIFPAIAAPDFMLLTLDDGTNIETIKLTAHTASSTTLTTIVRGQDGTTQYAGTWGIGTKIECRWTKGCVPSGSIVRETFSNAAYSIADTSDRLVAQIGTMSASRTVTLPSAAGRAGQMIEIVDESGSVTDANTIVISRAGSDTIEGLTSFALYSPYSKTVIYSDGTNKWFVRQLTVQKRTYTSGTNSFTEVPCRWVRIRAWGAGGSGGGGMAYVSSVAQGGNGGAGGGYHEVWMNKSEVVFPLQCTVPAGTTGGSGNTVETRVAGSAGGDATVLANNGSGSTLAKAGGGAGAGIGSYGGGDGGGAWAFSATAASDSPGLPMPFRGSACPTSGTTQKNCLSGGGHGGACPNSAASGCPGGNTVLGGAGGGCGGGHNNSGSVGTPTSGGTIGIYGSGSGAGTAGSNSATTPTAGNNGSMIYPHCGGGGGGGGGAAWSANGANGGNGGAPGGGGGGGGAGQSGGTGGNGGNGAAGQIVIEWGI